MYQVVGEILSPVRNMAVRKLKLTRDSIGHKLAQILVTFALTDFAWIFFRAQTMDKAIAVIKSIFTVKNPWILFDDSLFNCGLDRKNFNLMLICILILLIVDLCKYRNICIRNIIMKQDYWFRWITIALAITTIFLFGIWGAAFDESSFIYFQF